MKQRERESDTNEAHAARYTMNNKGSALHLLPASINLAEQLICKQGKSSDQFTVVSDGGLKLIRIIGKEVFKIILE